MYLLVREQNGVHSLIEYAVENGRYVQCGSVVLSGSSGGDLIRQLDSMRAACQSLAVSSDEVEDFG